jgi:hypothetical protein
VGILGAWADDKSHTIQVSNEHTVCMLWSCRWWGETISLNYGHQWAYCSSPRWYMSMENCGGYDIDRVKLLIHPSELAGNPSSSHLAASRGNGQREWWIWPCKVFLFILASDFLHAAKSYDMALPALLPLRKKACCRLLLPLKTHHSWVSTCKPWVWWQAR